MLILGVGVLGDLNTNATSQESLGMAFWRIVLSAGILAMIMSVINVIAVNRTSGFSERNADSMEYRALSSPTAILVSVHDMCGSMEQWRPRK